MSKRYRAITADHSARYQACALVVIGLFVVTNYVAYVIPNYHSGEFLIFCVLSLTFRHHLVARPQPLPVTSARPLRTTFREQRPC